MQNGLTRLSPTTSGSPGWDADRSPYLRLLWLFAVFAVPLLAILGRLADLQLRLQTNYISGFDVTTESFEDLPSTLGRLLAADGTVLAEDEPRYALQVHYRWIEDPPYKPWLKQQASRRLSAAERREPGRLEAEVQRVLALRESFWAAVAETAHRSPEEIQTARQKVQQRVESLHQRVEGRRSRQSAGEQTAAQGSDSAAGTADSTATLWTTLTERLRSAQQEWLSPPSRDREGSLTLQEELDYHTIALNLDAEAAAEFEAQPERFPAVRVQVDYRRRYPQRDLAAHLVGHRTALRAEEVIARKEQYPDGDPLDYREGDLIGRSGLERSYDSQLHGIRGRRRLVKNRQGEIISRELVRAPRPGRDVVVTLDRFVQAQSEALLDRALQVTTPAGNGTDDTAQVLSVANRPQGGVIVALDIQTGAVIALAAAPRFDANLLVHPDKETWEALRDDPRRPFFPRATEMALPPGSVFKALSALALVQSGGLEPDEPFYCRGYLDQPTKHRCLTFRHYGVGHGETRLGDALCRSCNVYFFTAARRAGPRPLIDWSRRFGIGQPTGIDLPNEEAGYLPAPDNNAANSRHWYPGDTLGLAIGQSSLMVTPLQMARLMAAIANGGALVTPHLVERSGDVSGNVSSGPMDHSLTGKVHSARPLSGLDAATLRAVRDGLEMVVNDKRGTGYKTVRLAEVKIAGKTGTAEVGPGKADHAWFAGYVPADRPRIAFAVVLEHGGSGGKAAGPVARELVRTLLEAGLIHRPDALAKDIDDGPN